jgi:hypothetical protein
MALAASQRELRRGQFTLSRMLLTVMVFGLFCGSLRLLYFHANLFSALLVFTLGILTLDLPMARLGRVLNRTAGRTIARMFDAFSICVMIFVLLAILGTFIPRLDW